MRKLVGFVFALSILVASVIGGAPIADASSSAFGPSVPFPAELMRFVAVGDDDPTSDGRTAAPVVRAPCACPIFLFLAGLELYDRFGDDAARGAEAMYEAQQAQAEAEADDPWYVQIGRAFAESTGFGYTNEPETATPSVDAPFD